jgi:hypothetical protein
VTMMFVTGRANVQIDFTYLQALWSSIVHCAPEKK